MRRIFKVNFEECEYHFVTISEAFLKICCVVKTSTLISLENIDCRFRYRVPFVNLTQVMSVIRLLRKKNSYGSDK